MATPSIVELLARLDEQQARIERLEPASMAPPASPAAEELARPGPRPAAGEPAQPGPRRAGLTRRGMVTAAAAGTAGIVGAMLAEQGAASAATGPGTFTSSSATPAVTATNTAKGFGVHAVLHGKPGVLVRIVARRKDVTAPRLNRVTLPDAPVHKPAGPLGLPPHKPAGMRQRGG